MPDAVQGRPQGAGDSLLLSAFGLRDRKNREGEALRKQVCVNASPAGAEASCSAGFGQAGCAQGYPGGGDAGWAHPGSVLCS